MLRRRRAMRGGAAQHAFVLPICFFLYAEQDGHLVVLTLGPDNRRIVRRVDSASGNRTLLSHMSPSASTSLPVAYLGIAIEASGQVIIADDRVDAIVRVDALGNGDHAVISK